MLNILRQREIQRRSRAQGGGLPKPDTVLAGLSSRWDWWNAYGIFFCCAAAGVAVISHWHFGMPGGFWTYVSFALFAFVATWLAGQWVAGWSLEGYGRQSAYAHMETFDLIQASLFFVGSGWIAPINARIVGSFSNPMQCNAEGQYYPGFENSFLPAHFQPMDETSGTKEAFSADYKHCIEGSLLLVHENTLLLCAFGYCVMNAFSKTRAGGFGFQKLIGYFAFSVCVDVLGCLLAFTSLQFVSKGLVYLNIASAEGKFDVWQRVSNAFASWMAAKTMEAAASDVLARFGGMLIMVQIIFLCCMCIVLFVYTPRCCWRWLMPRISDPKKPGYYVEMQQYDDAASHVTHEAQHVFVYIGCQIAPLLNPRDPFENPVYFQWSVISWVCYLIFFVYYSEEFRYKSFSCKILCAVLGVWSVYVMVLDFNTSSMKLIKSDKKV